MTDHTTEAERFRNEYLCLRIPGQPPITADVLALANYHATMAVVDAVRGLVPNTAQDAPGDDLPASRPEPGQVDGGEATEATGGDFPCCAPVPSTGGFVPRPWSLDDAVTQARLAITRAEKAEAECDSWQQRTHEAENAQDQLADQRDEWRARAEKAEAERNAVLTDLWGLKAEASRLLGDFGWFSGARMELHLEELVELIDRHTPEG